MMNDTGNEPREIPFGKPVRVGNFKLCRASKNLGRGKSRMAIDQIVISTLDESWQVRIPATAEMYYMLQSLYSERRDVHLVDFFSNMLYVSHIPNGYFQRAVTLCSVLYANPDVLKEDNESHKDMVQDVRDIISGFLKWRKEYERSVAANDGDMEREQVAEDILDEVAATEKEENEKEQ